MLDRDPVAALGAAKAALSRGSGRKEVDGVIRRPVKPAVQHSLALPWFDAASDRMYAHTAPVETPDFFADPVVDPSTGPAARAPRPATEGLWAAGDRITWIAGLILALSSFMDWYAGSGVGVKLAVIGWHTGILGKLVFFIGFAVVVLVALRHAGMGLPPTVPESLVVLALGALATVFVVIRVISIPDSVLPADGRGIGLWISLIAAFAVIGGGLLQAAEEL